MNTKMQKSSWNALFFVVSMKELFFDLKKNWSHNILLYHVSKVQR